MLPAHEWLPHAQRLAVGQSGRFRHRHEHRLNLVVQNLPDRYVAYCQRCHEGGVQMKEHVVLTGAIRAPDQNALALPTDAVVIQDSPARGAVFKFLLTKGMALEYLPEAVRYSARSARLLVPIENNSERGWIGRSLATNVNSKWVNYSGVQYAVLPSRQSSVGIVVEDMFSAYKVQYALQWGGLSATVICALGTGCTDSLCNFLAQLDHVIWFFDGDAAGEQGALQGARRLAPYVVRKNAVFPPNGQDPKDMSCYDIVQLLQPYIGDSDAN